MLCQAQPIPTDECIACTEASNAGTCASLRSQCNEADECVPYGQCQYECYRDETCCSRCELDHPSGHAQYAELMQCVVCDACAEACRGLFPALCGD